MKIEIEHRFELPYWIFIDDGSYILNFESEDIEIGVRNDQWILKTVEESPLNEFHAFIPEKILLNPKFKEIIDTQHEFHISKRKALSILILLYKFDERVLDKTVDELIGSLKIRSFRYVNKFIELYRISFNCEKVIIPSFKNLPNQISWVSFLKNFQEIVFIDGKNYKPLFSKDPLIDGYYPYFTINKDRQNSSHSLKINHLQIINISFGLILLHV